MKGDGIFLFTQKTCFFKTLWLSKNIAEFLHGLDPFGTGQEGAGVKSVGVVELKQSRPHYLHRQQ